MGRVIFGELLPGGTVLKTVKLLIIHLLRHGRERREFGLRDVIVLRQRMSPPGCIFITALQISLAPC